MPHLELPQKDPTPVISHWSEEIVASYWPEGVEGSCSWSEGIAEPYGSKEVVGS